MTGSDSDSLRLVRRTTVAGMEPESPPTGALAPFRSRAFLWLWLGVVISSIGSWSQTVGAQWLFINDPNAATIVSLVQTASALPMVLLALVGGVLSDAFDRRRLMIWVQVYFVVVASMLSLLSSMHLVPPLLLLAFTFAIGVGSAIQLPTWQPLITELVPRSQIAAATRLDMVSVNVARAVGPAIAGLVIAAFGVPPVFAFNAACTLFLVLALLAWRREPKIEVRARERFLPALRAGGRYVWHEPVVRLILVRLAMFIAPATAMWAIRGRSAHIAVAGAMNIARRTRMSRTTGSCHTYRPPARSAGRNRSLARTSIFGSRRQASRARMRNSVQAALNANTGGTPNAAITRPAIAGPTARATLTLTMSS